jgi:hypothetical protein
MMYRDDLYTIYIRSLYVIIVIICSYELHLEYTCLSDDYREFSQCTRRYHDARENPITFTSLHWDPTCRVNVSLVSSHNFSIDVWSLTPFFEIEMRYGASRRRLYISCVKIVIHVITFIHARGVKSIFTFGWRCPVADAIKIHVNQIMTMWKKIGLATVITWK